MSQKVRFAKRELKFHKVDSAEGVAYGWLIVSTIKGEPYFDLQGDHIPLAAAKRAMADFMKNSRASDDQHDERTIGDVVYCLPVEKGVTTELVGLDGDLDREGIVIGFKPHDPAVLGKIASGERNGFSIGGSLSEAHYVEKRNGKTRMRAAAVGKELRRMDEAYAKDVRAAATNKTEPPLRRVFDEFTINFASLVDWPAQEGALVSVVKAATVQPGTLMWIRKDAVLTSEEKGHQHVIDPDDDLDDDGDCGWTGYATASGDEYPHSHEFVVDGKTGAVTIATNDGHGHTVDLVVGRPRTATEDNASTAQVLTVNMRAPASVVAAMSSPDGERMLLDAIKRNRVTIDKGVRGAVAGQNDQTGLASVVKENEMTPEQIAELQALAEMNDRHKVFYRTLSKRDAQHFISLTSAQRDAQVKSDEDGDPVVYKCDDGTEVRKSAGVFAERLARKTDAQERELVKMRAAAENATFEKRASVELGHYPGELRVRALLLKAVVNGIADEKDQKLALAVIKAGDKALSKGFARKGQNVPESQDDEDDNFDPDAAFDSLAKAYAKENKVSIHKAYDLVAKTPEGQALYAEMEVRAGRALNYSAHGGEDNGGGVDNFDDDDSQVQVDEPDEGDATGTDE